MTHPLPITRSIAIGITLACAGCNWMNESFLRLEREGCMFSEVSGTSPRQFWATCTPSRLNELHGPESAEFKNFLRTELQSRGICSTNYQVLEVHSERASYGIRGACS